jgi:hypothetical protein
MQHGNKLQVKFITQAKEIQAWLIAPTQTMAFGCWHGLGSLAP